MGGSRPRWVSMCTVWLSHSKWLSEYSKESTWNFAISLSTPLWKLFRWFRRPQLWVTGDWQLHHNIIPTHAWRLMHSFLAKHEITQVTQPPTAQIWHPASSAFPQTKTTFEREKTSHHRWDLGKYGGVADGYWENCVRSQGAYFEGDLGVVVLCTMSLVSSSVNISIFHITGMDTFWKLEN